MGRRAPSMVGGTGPWDRLLAALLVLSPTAGLAAVVLSPTAAIAAEGFAPEPPGPPPVRFRGDFRAGWNLTDGSGMIDHVGLELTFGPQIGDATVGGPPAIAPLLGGAFGIAEDFHLSMRVFAGAEFAIAVLPKLELVPAFFGGFLKQWKNDERQGPLARAAFGVRIISDEDFFLVFEPLSITVLPPPPGGFTRYTTHVSLDVSFIKFGGRTR